MAAAAAAQCTHSLVQARLHDHQHVGAPGGALVARHMYALTLVRFVNGFCDVEQKGREARSVASLAAALGIPETLVDLRHDATHGTLPSLAVLRLAGTTALAWLRTT